ncbi:MAG: adenosylcobinamide amidohydrolase [Thermodesulfobacteriota bacterium]
MGKHPAGFPRIWIWFPTIVLTLLALPAFSLPVTITDADDRPVTITRAPQRVVSLVPAVTEIIAAIGAGEAVKGITCHDADSIAGGNVTTVGGFASPDLEIIASLNPDIIFISDLHPSVKDRWKNSPCPVVCFPISSIADSLEVIDQLGRIFDRQNQAGAVIRGIHEDIDLIAKKTARIPPRERRRVIRLMGDKAVMTPGQGSFQNEMIRAAGGIAHAIDRNGTVIPVSVEQWRAFDPQVIYGCDGDERVAAAFFNLPGWKEVSAVRSGRITYFPCDLTCRAATHTGEFVSWLAASIYTDSFSNPANLVLKEGIMETAGLATATDLPVYVKNARIVRSRLYDFIHKTLVLDFARPTTVLSSLEGWRDNIRTVGNHYLPPPCWPISHQIGWDPFRNHVLNVLGQDQADTSFLYTGADMDHLSARKKTYRDLTVWALVTAGVSSNAMRMSADEGLYYEPGTINIILLANTALSRRAMTRAVITATEAKTAALQDMDIRSSYSGKSCQATGTGTDQVIVIQGAGNQALDNAEGHSRLGQLIAETVYAGVREAVAKQNRLTEKRGVFRRLEERGISLYGLVDLTSCECNRPESAMVAELEKRLLDPAVAGFIELALAVSDDHEKGLLTDLTAFNRLALDICSQVAEKEVTRIRDHITRDDLPVVMATTFNALLTGIYQRQPEQP